LVANYTTGQLMLAVDNMAVKKWLGVIILMLQMALGVGTLSKPYDVNTDQRTPGRLDDL